MKYKDFLLYPLLWIVLFVFLQSTYKFHFYHIEQYLLFLFDSSYIWTNLKTVGGLTSVLNEFLTQFFIYPYAGAGILTTLLTIIGIQTYGIVKQIAQGTGMFILLSILPVAALLSVHFDFNYFMQGTIAYSLMLLAFRVYLSLTQLKWKLTYSVLATLLLFWWGGPIAILFSGSILLKELLEKPSQSFWFLIPCIVAVSSAAMSVRLAMVGDFRFAFLPDAYYHNAMQPKNFAIYLSWMCFPAIVVIACLLRKRKAVSNRTQIISVCLQILVVFILFQQTYKNFGDEKSLKFKEIEYYSRTAQWDKILDANKGNIPNFLYACYLNIALSKKGELADKMFAYDQLGEKSMIVPWDKTHAISMLLSDVYEAMDYTGAAQEMAFEGNISSPGAKSGRMLQRLVETNLIYGEYPVAEKYIDLLEKTLYYSDWATEHRKYLYNDAELEKNPVLNGKRKSLPQRNILFPIIGIEKELENMAISNPENKTSIQFLGTLLLLNKNLEAFQEMIDTYYGTEVLPSLPLSFQEAVVILNEHASDTWTEMGISDKTISNFKEYKRAILAYKNDKSLGYTIRNTFGNTYWYYFMFK